MTVQQAQTTIEANVMAWEGVEGEAHFGNGRLYRVGQREVGHIHGDDLVDIPFPKKVHDAVIAAGRADIHHVLPESGWVCVYLRQSEDVQTAIDLLKVSYDLAVAQQARKEANATA